MQELLEVVGVLRPTDCERNDYQTHIYSDHQNYDQNYEEMRVFVVIKMVVIKMMIKMMIMMMIKMMMMTCGQHCAHVRCRHFHTWMITLMNMMNMMILTVMMTVTMSPNLLAHWNLF